MAIKVESNDTVTGVAYYRSHSHIARAHDILEDLAEGNLPHDLEEDEPAYSRFEDVKVFKITITVEEV